ncbi:hypothetical protein [Rossellomorea sp. BNER]|uniref:hypothetical protein n=1 Tax=Rossellomorea sp. BNER TaxID=2962031 RepID=UPI003AF2454B|nr:hypothetical protein [Rossellomorea sp. BNER]
MRPNIVLKFIFIFLLMSSLSLEVSADNLPYSLESMEWEEVEKIIPRDSKFTVIDVESGKSFEVQRRAGSSHADVQPLTKKDTKIMKKIYGGKWSWNRRAILVLVDDQLIAASMHGMPHGGGALDNSFSGHFCIHFKGSTTHGSHKKDPAHQLMILKASQELDEYLLYSDPIQIINALFISMKNKDSTIFNKVIHHTTISKRLTNKVKKIENIKILQVPKLTPDEYSGFIVIEVPIEFELIQKGVRKEVVEGNLVLIKEGAGNQWYIDGESLAELL